MDDVTYITNSFVSRSDIPTPRHHPVHVKVCVFDWFLFFKLYIWVYAMRCQFSLIHFVIVCFGFTAILQNLLSYLQHWHWSWICIYKQVPIDFLHMLQAVCNTVCIMTCTGRVRWRQWTKQHFECSAKQWQSDSCGTMDCFSISLNIILNVSFVSGCIAMVMRLCHHTF